MVASIAARSALTVACQPSTDARLLSTEPCEMNCRASRSCARRSWRCASASAAESLASWACALAMLASSVRASRLKSRSPAFTYWPSLTFTLVMTELTWGLTSTVRIGVTTPAERSRTARSFISALTVVTVTGGAGAADAPGFGMAAAPPLAELVPVGWLAVAAADGPAEAVSAPSFLPQATSKEPSTHTTKPPRTTERAQPKVLLIAYPNQKMNDSARLNPQRALAHTHWGHLIVSIRRHGKAKNSPPISPGIRAASARPAPSPPHTALASARLRCQSGNAAPRTSGKSMPRSRLR